jgi:peptide/nickel transport system permease protein
MAERAGLLKTMPTVEEIVGPTPGQILRRRIFGHRGLMIGGGILLGILLIALLAPVIVPHDPYAQTLGKRLLPPIWQAKGTWTHLLGTDQLGRDYLSRLLYGAQVSLLIGIAAAVLSGFIGTALGLTAGYFGGRVDMVITYLITVRLSIPVILVALATIQLVGGSLKVVIIVLGFLLWDRFAVVIRSSTMQIRAMDYVKSAQAVGCSLFSILFREMLPNVFNQLMVIATLEMAHAILLEAALSFLGVGVQPPTPSWGLMINEGKNFMFFKPYLVMIPGVALFLLVLAINLMGDGVRDVTAPESRS